jgi:membrane metallo-endopeptidase-like protein 1
LFILFEADSIDTKIGYPDFIKNDTYLDVLYESYKVTAKNSFFQNLIEITLTSSVRHFKSLRSVMNNKGWLIGPAVINAFYSPSSNQIYFPAGILQAPFYEASAPKYLNYGGIGSVIGHEITHGFDDKGRLYDKDGIYFPESESLWTNKFVSIPQ